MMRSLERACDKQGLKIMGHVPAGIFYENARISRATAFLRRSRALDAGDKTARGRGTKRALTRAFGRTKKKRRDHYFRVKASLASIGSPTGNPAARSAA